MGRGAELIGFVLLFDIVVIGGYLLLTEPLGMVVWIVPTLALFSLVIAAYLFGRLSSDAASAARPPHRSGESNRSFRQRPAAFSGATPDSSCADTRNRTPAERRSTGVGERLSAGVRLRVSAPELSGVASENADGLWRTDRFDFPER